MTNLWERLATVYWVSDRSQLGVWTYGLQQ
jgi:hypothetical protein